MSCICIHDDDRHVGSICSPAKIWVRTVRKCPGCKEVHRLVGFDQAWYGITWTCVGCGDSFTSEEFLPRPFQRGWRAKAIAAARERWPQATALGSPAHRAWLRESLR